MDSSKIIFYSAGSWTACTRMDYDTGETGVGDNLNRGGDMNLFCASCAGYADDNSGKQTIYTGYCEETQTYCDRSDPACKKYFDAEQWKELAAEQDRLNAEAQAEYQSEAEMHAIQDAEDAERNGRDGY